MSRQQAVQPSVPVETLRIRKHDIPVEIRMLNQKDLRFYPLNPRIYSIVRPDEKEPSQEDIEARLLDRDDLRVRELSKDIQRDGGLTEPLIVRGGTNEVLEGNRRLAAYRFLARENPVQWALVKCTILPEDTDEKLIFALLGQYHIKGKKNWEPYEQAGFLYRRFKLHRDDISALADEIGLGELKVRQLIEAYQFMLDFGETDIRRWSYFFEYTRSKKIGKARKNFPDLDDVIVEKIRSEEIAKATDIRDRLSTICEASPKIIRKFVAGKSDFEEAWEAAVDAGGTDDSYKKLKRFRSWIAREEIGNGICAATGERRERVKYELKKVYSRVAGLLKRLPD